MLLAKNIHEGSDSMKIGAVFEFSSTNSFSADTNLERRHEPEQLQILSKILIKVISQPLDSSRKV